MEHDVTEHGAEGDDELTESMPIDVHADPASDEQPIDDAMDSEAETGAREPEVPGGEPVAPGGSEPWVNRGWTPPPPPPAPPAPLAPVQRVTTPLRSLVAVGLGCALIGGAVGGGIVAVANHGATTSGVSIVPIHDGSSPAAVLPSGESIPALVQSVLPSVVSIDSSGGGSEDQGTGMVLTSDGLILTNNHVIANSASAGVITVTVSGSTAALPATLVGRDPSNDVALLRVVNAKHLHPITFARSEGVVVGTAVVAIGNALGLAAGTPTVTSGIVSALGRTVTAGDSSSNATETLSNMIQTDAAINPGNSGGPLLNARGQVIGMNTAVAGATSDGTSAQNIGFAIPSDHLASLIATLEENGTRPASVKAFLGVYLISMTPELQQQYGFAESTGAIVTEVNPGSPADNAGLNQGDVILRANGKPTPTADSLGAIIDALKPGDKLTMRVDSNGTLHTVVATLGVRS